ncbi:hypothetical protein [Marinomonas spartinae]|uniref:hypothetical protein n=1 Tax=Marinomonas spartinae TaxID=1792290 RepID=UPI0018F10937|nr:hypothetical protein [Marinomonas spartinae]MBJ7555389.1 hypothetical protein [Marinomonas spartinae]
MFDQLQPIREALVAAIEELGVDVFAQRKIPEDDIKDDRFVALSLPRSDDDSDGVSESWLITMVLGVYISNPATDAALESFASQVIEQIKNSAALNALVSGVLFAGHEYPEEQGEAFASLDIQYTLYL